MKLTKYITVAQQWVQVAGTVAALWLATWHVEKHYDIPGISEAVIHALGAVWISIHPVLAAVRAGQQDDNTRNFAANQNSLLNLQSQHVQDYHSKS